MNEFIKKQQAEAREESSGPEKVPCYGQILGLNATVRKALTEARQAGIDEAVEIVGNMPFHYSDSGVGCYVDKDDTIKALQNKK